MSPLHIPAAAELPTYRGEYGPDQGPRKVLISPLLMVQIAEAASARRVTVDWGEPDDEGFYTPTITTHEEARP